MVDSKTNKIMNKKREAKHFSFFNLYYHYGLHILRILYQEKIQPKG